jgi:predicted DNA-binding protein
MMSIQMLIRIDPEIKNKLNQLARNQGKNTSQMLREIIEDYIRDRDISGYIDDLWNRIGKKLKKKNIKPGDIKTAIKQVRSKKS